MSTLMQDNFTDNDPDGLPWDSGLTVGTVSETGGVLSATIVNSGQDYIAKTLLGHYPDYWMEFMVRVPSAGFSFGDATWITFAELYNGTDAIDQFWLYLSNSGVVWQTACRDDDSYDYSSSGFSPSLDTWYTIRAYYKFSTAPGADNGIRRLWIDDMDTPVIDVTNLDNDLDINDALTVVLGNVWTDGSTAAGTFEYKSFRLWTGEDRVRWPFPSFLG